jgi:hypothetical protein
LTYQLAEEVGNTAVRDIRHESVEEECPGHGVNQSFLQLIGLEVLVADPLLVYAHARNGQNPVFLLQPARVQLAVGNEVEEVGPQCDGQEAGHQKDNLPGFDC